MVFNGLSTFLFDPADEAPQAYFLSFSLHLFSLLVNLKEDGNSGSSSRMTGQDGQWHQLVLPSQEPPTWIGIKGLYYLPYAVIKKEKMKMHCMSSL